MGLRVLPCLLAFSLLTACGAAGSESGSASTPPPAAASIQKEEPPVVSDGADQAEFTVTRQDDSVLDENGEAVAILYYDQVVLAGDSAAFARINDSIDREHKDFLSQENHDDFAYNYEMQKPRISPENPLLHTMDAQVAQNGDGVLSILLTEQWYQGGVFNQNYCGLTYDLRTGEAVGLAQLLDRDEDTLAGELAGIVRAALVDDVDVIPEDLDKLEDYALGDFDFHIKDGEVILTFPTYALACGAMGPLTVSTGLTLPARS